ncbi:unnamed protein product, partial [Urochloa humidicola]
ALTCDIPVTETPVWCFGASCKIQLSKPVCRVISQADGDNEPMISSSNLFVSFVLYACNLLQVLQFI